MSETRNDQATAEDQLIWAELDELDSSAFSGPPISESLYQERFESIKNGSYKKKYLEILYNEKQKLLLKLERLEQFEAALKADIE
jgi:hypothetical protein